MPAEPFLPGISYQEVLTLRDYSGAPCDVTITQFDGGENYDLKFGYGQLSVHLFLTADDLTSLMILLAGEATARDAGG